MSWDLRNRFTLTHCFANWIFVGIQYPAYRSHRWSCLHVLRWSGKTWCASQVFLRNKYCCPPSWDLKLLIAAVRHGDLMKTMISVIALGQGQVPWSREEDCYSEQPLWEEISPEQLYLTAKTLTTSLCLWYRCNTHRTDKYISMNNIHSWVRNLEFKHFD